MPFLVAAIVLVAGLLVGCSAQPVIDRSPSSEPAPQRSAASDDVVRDLLALLPRETTYLERLAACLRASGWEAEVSSDGEELSYDFGDPSRRDEFQQDKRACDILVPAPSIVPLTEEQIRHVYDYWVEMRECIAGFGIITSEPPTVDEFLRTWETGPWSPYLDVPGRALERVDERCPQTPPDQ